jgi:hypothetical protein
MIEAFKPLGVYLKFWGDGEPGTEMTRSQWFPIHGGTDRRFSVVLVNDDQDPVSGKLVLSLENLEGKTLASSEKPFRLDGVGKATYELSVPIPLENGKYLLKAVAYPQSSRHKSPTVSRRKISVEPIAAVQANGVQDGTAGQKKHTASTPGETNGSATQAPNIQDLLQQQ